MLYLLCPLIAFKLARGLMLGTAVYLFRKKIDRITVLVVIGGVFPVIGTVLGAKEAYDLFMKEVEEGADDQP